MVLPSHIAKYPDFVRSKTYAFLRERGLEYLRQMAAVNWTDHNTHDPGITLLEMLAYAITDLGYKTDFSVEDILAEKTLCDTKAGSEDSPDFFSAREILPCNPLTLEDFRKLMIDVPGVANGWLLMKDESEPPIYLDCKGETLTYTQEPEFDRINIQGLYDVMLSLEKDPVLGDMNQWRFPLNLPGRKSALLYMAPVWHLALEMHITPVDVTGIYTTALESLPKTKLYKGTLSLSAGPKVLEVPYHLESPLEKTSPSQFTLETALNNALPDLRDYLKSRLEKSLIIAKDVRGKLHQHRTLCEDYEKLLPAPVEDVGLCTDLEVRPDADMEKILGEVYFAMEKFLQPKVAFYTLEEMRGFGYSTEEIFNGTLIKHGFIREEDLQATEFRSEIHVSDIIQILMDIDGVLAVKNILVSLHKLGEVLNDGENWCLHLSPQHRQRFHLDKSKIVFYKGMLPYSAEETKALAHLKALQGLAHRPRLRETVFDVPIPKGIHRHLQWHHSIQNDFPLVYGIGPEGLPQSATDQRKAQAKQLKAYLSLMDQILADYASQLSHVKSLLSLKPHVHRTYFSKSLESLPETYRLTAGSLQVLADKGWNNAQLNALNPLVDQEGRLKDDFTAAVQPLLNLSFYLAQKDNILEAAKIPAIPAGGIPDSANLYREFVEAVRALDPNIDLDNSKSLEPHWKAFVLTLKQRTWDDLCQRNDLLESAQTYYDRKNRFLDHLMSRFAEQFTDYVLLASHLEGPKAPEDLIEDKLAFLKDYPVISRDRGKAFNYLMPVHPENEFAKNVSGLEHRVSRLTGISNWHRRELAQLIMTFFEFYQEIDDDGIDEYRFRLKNDKGKILLSSSTRYYTMEAAIQEAEVVLGFGLNASHYLIQQTRRGRFYFNLIDDSGEIIARRIQYFDTEEKAEAARDHLVSIMEKISKAEEGFHLLEHVLIRPIAEGDELLKVCVSEECDCCLGFRDPYSFRATAVVPYWPRRFRNMDFRRFFESTLRAEAPAHVHVKICWVDREDMKRFEEAYFPWLELRSNPETPIDELRDAQDKLLLALESLRSVYPEVHLHDCEDEGNENSVLLNHSKLGSTKGD